MTAYVYDDKKWADTLELVDAGAKYALTGAVFADDRYAVEEAHAALRYSAGNFYVNDKPTGAVVGQQPFGGARASGHERQGRLDVEPDPLGQPADGEGDVRAGDRLPLPLHGLRGGSGRPLTSRHVSESGFEETRRLALPGVELAYRELGTGEPLLLVHGGASDLRTWTRQLPAFAEAYRTIVYSRRYARPNARIDPEAEDPIDAHVADQVALIGALGASPASIVGHSWGGFVSLLTASRHPDSVRTLVLIEPPVLTLLANVPPNLRELARLFVRNPAACAAFMKFGAGAAAPAERAFRRGDDETALRKFGSGVLGRAAFSELTPERLEQARENIDVDRAQLLGAGFPSGRR